MINRLSKGLETVTFKLWLLFLLMSQSIYAIMQSYSIPRICQEAGGLLIFDMNPLGYTYEYAHKFLSQLSEEGYTLYLHVQLPLDILFPILNGLTGLSTFILLLRLYNKVKNTSASSIYSSFSKAALALPLVAMLFDYLENIMIFMMLSYKAAVPIILVYAASTFTIIKSISTLVFYIVVIAILLVNGAAWIRSRSKKEQTDGEFRD
ncbi:hypothetical protein MKX70_09470 [Paenibacillus sp. FSL R7-0312]|uniref:hypothetical protein n=1 Tax=Paenibacillus sp. FSL R7-0312 TaxID=2921682 RepID=UPI0030F5A3F1